MEITDMNIRVLPGNATEVRQSTILDNAYNVADIMPDNSFL